MPPIGFSIKWFALRGIKVDGACNRMVFPIGINLRSLTIWPSRVSAPVLGAIDIAAVVWHDTNAGEIDFKARNRFKPHPEIAVSKGRLTVTPLSQTRLADKAHVIHIMAQGGETIPTNVCFRIGSRPLGSKRSPGCLKELHTSSPDLMAELFFQLKLMVKRINTTGTANRTADHLFLLQRTHCLPAPPVNTPAVSAIPLQLLSPVCQSSDDE